MATITIRNVPDDLHRQLQEQAARNQRSLDKEILQRLERSVRAPTRLEADARLARLSALRERQRANGVCLTPDDVQSAIERGRT